MESLALNSFIITISVFSALVTILLSSLVAYGFEPMYEDQVIVCNIDSVCKIINVDDYFIDQGEELQQEFAYDLDTFSMEELS